MSGITVTSVTTVDLSLERLIGVGVLFTRVGHRERDRSNVGDYRYIGYNG